VETLQSFRFEEVVGQICGLRWEALSRAELLATAHAYYYFSIQFRENLEMAVELSPDDSALAALYEGECNTSNLSPYPEIAEDGEAMNHDEFMRRVIDLTPITPEQAIRQQRIGECYLGKIGEIDKVVRASSIASYEDGGLENVFNAILRAKDWNDPALLAFRHFLVAHIAFDSDVEGGHGALSRHIAIDDRILPIWIAFYDMFIESCPTLLLGNS
jgi:hypothetical protein